MTLHSAVPAAEALRFEAITTRGVPLSAAEQMFAIEADTFGAVYKECPSTAAEFRQKYDRRLLHHVICWRGDEVVGFRGFEHVNNDHALSTFMVVVPALRGLGLASTICAMSAAYLRVVGYRWVSSWTHVDIWAATVLAGYAPRLSTDPLLSTKENELLRDLEQFSGKEPGSWGSNRRVPGYYTMLDGRVGDANYWAHDLLPADDSGR